MAYNASNYDLINAAIAAVNRCELPNAIGFQRAMLPIKLGAHVPHAKLIEIAERLRTVVPNYVTRDYVENIDETNSRYPEKRRYFINNIGERGTTHQFCDDEIVQTRYPEAYLLRPKNVSLENWRPFLENVCLVCEELGYLPFDSDNVDKVTLQTESSNTPDHATLTNLPPAVQTSEARVYWRSLNYSNAEIVGSSFFNGFGSGDFNYASASASIFRIHNPYSYTIELSIVYSLYPDTQAGGGGFYTTSVGDCTCVYDVPPASGYDGTAAYNPRDGWYTNHVVTLEPGEFAEFGDTLQDFNLATASRAYQSAHASSDGYGGAGRFYKVWDAFYRRIS